MSSVFVAIYSFFASRRLLLYSVFVACIMLFVFLGSKLSFDSDMQSMIPAAKTGKDITSVLLKNKALDKIVVSVSLKDSTQRDPDVLMSYMESFAENLQQLDSTKLISRVETAQDEEQFVYLVQALQENLPFLLNEKDYTAIDSLITEDGLRNTLEQNYRTLATPGGLALKQLLAKDPIGLSWFAMKKLNDLQLDENTTLYDGYIFSKDESHATFFIYTTYPSSDTKHNKPLLNLLHGARVSVESHEEFKNVDCHYFGGQLVAAGNATQMQADTILTLSITIALLLLILILFFRNAFAPLQIMIPVLFGGLFSMAMLYLLRGKVSLMALGASSVILGIAINYSLHFLTHLRHSGSIKDTIRELTTPMTIGSFTTVFAFTSLLLVHTPVLQELGLFTAFNLIGSSLCTLIFLPHFVKTPAPHIAKTTWLDKLSMYHPNKNKWVVLGIVTLTLVLGFYSNDVRFNEDMMKMNFMTNELSTSQDIINQRNAESLNSVFLVAEGNSMEDAFRENEKALEQLDTLKSKQLIRKYNSVSQFLLSSEKQQQKIAQWNAFWTADKKQKLTEQMVRIGTQIGFNATAFEPVKTMLAKTYSKPDSLYTQVFTQLFKDLVSEEKGRYKVLSLLKIKQENREKVYAAIQPTDTHYLTDRQLMTSHFVQFIKDDFYQILALTSLIVFLTILISYGRIEIALISFIPMVVTWICILGLMGLFGIEFNIINIIISTLIFGLGDDYSIFITDSLIEKYKYGKLKINSVKTSIYLSAITTMIGLGILVFAKHPALKSIALVSVIGIASILIVSQTLQPLLFNFFIQNRTDKKQHPFTLWSFAKTIYAFTYYVVGCLAVTVVGFLLTKCIPLAKDKMKYIYHVVICKMMWSLLYMMANVKKRFFDKELFDPSKPSVIIANHASFLDLLRIISLHPKILLLTNKWVWRSPVFGALVRMADYYPVEEGAEFSIDKMKYWVDRGYSIAVFPEGTRSYTDDINRFHKGAFYIAEKLNLDIQPAIFHGIGYCIRKGDFLLKDGEINVKFLPRIAPSDTRYGNTYSERARKIGKYFRLEYDKLRKERETVCYFKEQLIRNYQYKGPVLEWYCRIKIRLEKYYEPIEKWVPKSGEILDIGCGYGFLDYMLAWTSSERKITGIDYDEEKIEVANHNFSKTEQLNFIAGDGVDFPTSKTYDCILIMDVLHYLTPEKQIQLLEKCNLYLKPNGSLIVRDGMENLGSKHKGTKLTEFFSTKLFGFNKTENELHFLSEDMLKDFAKRNNLSRHTIDETKFTSNVMTIFTKA
jgi:1-acyl-sn-glycerol-3-phosphate acyltransferase